MSKRFRDYDPDQMLLLPPSLQDWLPENHLARFIRDAVDAMDLKKVYASYDKSVGQPPYSPRMLVAVWLYAYCSGVRSSRRVARAMQEDVAFRFLSANQQPNFWTLNEFRTRHLKALEDLFLQSIHMAERAGLVKMKNVAVDGTKIKANASKHSAMSYDRMGKEEERLRAEIQRFFKEADEIDRAEDEEFGARRGDELPDHLNTAEKRRKAIQEAKKALEEEAKEKARADQKKRREQAEEDGREFHPRSDPEEAKPDPKAQRNFTDPESRIMRNSDKAYIQAYNGQAAVDAESQVIVAADLTNQASDTPQLAAILEQIEANTGQLPDALLADAGYFSADNIRLLDRALVDAFIPPDRIKHSDWKNLKPPRGRMPAGLSIPDKMRWRLRTKAGRARYKLRQCSVEPTFGQIKSGRGLQQFLHRGLEKVHAMWLLECAAHNLLKIFRSGFRPVFGG